MACAIFYDLPVGERANDSPVTAPDLQVVPDAPPDTPTVGHRGELLTRIDGVELARLAPLVDHRGSLMEVIDFGAAFWREPVVYAYQVMVLPGRIKGWGMHKLQADRYFVFSGRLRVVLYDGRVRSPTHGRLAEFHFADDAPGLLRIPPGVWHADQNTGDHEARLLNFPTRAYDRDQPDKYRIDPHSGAIPFDWELRDS
jgi:dTDP-4-dehydrorhamnose 3,5-epimerase